MVGTKSVTVLSAASWGSSDALFALATQGWPDAANLYWFPQCVLRPGQTYRQRTVWRFYTADGAGEAWGAS